MENYMNWVQGMASAAALLLLIGFLCCCLIAKPRPHGDLRTSTGACSCDGFVWLFFFLFALRYTFTSFFVGLTLDSFVKESFFCWYINMIMLYSSWNIRFLTVDLQCYILYPGLHVILNIFCILFGPILAKTMNNPYFTQNCINMM